VRADYGASIEETRIKLQFDLYYVKRHSLWLDLRIMAETVMVVLTGRGAR
jgi:lipopolysaccharide/colanic/teichoic acid biosynthesis glycosyltransferase